ncbi:alpha-ketoglutarate transporter, partial [Klebsiella pneumoniae]
LNEQQLHDWGWRIPFFIGALLAIVVFRIRRGLLETQSFKNAQTETDQPKSGMFALFKHYPKEDFTVLFLTAGGTLAFYTYTTYLQKYLVNTSG